LYNVLQWDDTTLPIYNQSLSCIQHIHETGH
jgi:hypothetical protein